MGDRNYRRVAPTPVLFPVRNTGLENPNFSNCIDDSPAAQSQLLPETEADPEQVPDRRGD